MPSRTAAQLENEVVCFTKRYRNKCRSVGQFLNDLEVIRTDEELAGKNRLFFRGHGDTSFELKPHVGRITHNGRRFPITDDPRQEGFLLERFTRYAHRFTGRVLSKWEMFFLARHYGLPTRLLDWTRNPLAAMYFACVSHPETNGDLWAIRHRKSARDDRQHTITITDQTDDPLLRYNGQCRYVRPGKKVKQKRKADHCSHGPPDYYAAFKIVYPIYNSPRIVAQDGVFTLHTDVTLAMEDCAKKTFCPKRLDVDRLFRWTIPRANKGDILRELDRMGISRSLLFPELQGIAEGLTEVLVLHSGKPT